MSALSERAMIAERALRDITRCDYRGNEPVEQTIARLALADIQRLKAEPERLEDTTPTEGTRTSAS